MRADALRISYLSNGDGKADIGVTQLPNGMGGQHQSDCAVTKVNVRVMVGGLGGGNDGSKEIQATHHGASPIPSDQRPVDDPPWLWCLLARRCCRKWSVVIFGHRVLLPSRLGQLGHHPVYQGLSTATTTRAGRV